MENVSYLPSPLQPAVQWALCAFTTLSYATNNAYGLCYFMLGRRDFFWNSTSAVITHLQLLMHITSTSEALKISWQIAKDTYQNYANDIKIMCIA